MTAAERYAATDGPRFVLTDRIRRTNRLAGAWWPWSDDLATELPPLLRSLATIVGNVQGVMLNRNEWPGTLIRWQPLSMPRLRVSWYGVQDPNSIVVVGRTPERLGLLVIPPSTERATATIAMRLAAKDGNRLSAAEVLSAAAVRTAKSAT